MDYTSIIVNNSLFKVPSWFGNAIKRLLCSFFAEFDHKEAFSQFKNWLNVNSNTEKLLTDNMVDLSDDLRNRIIEVIDDIRLHENDKMIKREFFNKFLSTSMSTKQVPQFMSQLLNIDADGIGKGEACIPFLFSNVKWLKAGNRYDFEINGEYWHFKDHRNADSTPMGRPKGSEQFFATPIMKFIQTLGVNVSFFGVEDFKNNTKIEKAICNRYKTNDIYHAAELFENELNDEFRKSAFMGDAKGVLYLVNEENIDYVKRVDKHHVCLYANSSRGLAASTIPGRFVKAIVSRTRKEEEAKKLQLLKEKKLEERKRMFELKKAAKEEEKRAKKALRRQKQAQVAKEFVNEYRKQKTMKATAKALSISISTATARKKLAIDLMLW